MSLELEHSHCDVWDMEGMKDEWMPLEIRRELPNTFEELKQAVYQGTLFLIPAFPESLALVEYAKITIFNGFGKNADLQKIHEELPGEAILRIMTNVRKILAHPELSKHHISQITQPLGLKREQTVFDVLRQRWNSHAERFIENTYNTIHRDTWYANPQCQLNWWISLFDVSQEQTFQFFPSYFHHQIANTSHGFDYDRWAQEVGFQTNKRVDTNHYPMATKQPVDPHIAGFSCKAGDVLIFSAAHLHRTAHNTSGQTRFSIDFRTVDLEDKKQGLGAPNVDNHSLGDATVDYSLL